ncbi:MAG: hypothetical protein WEA09_14660 [Gemmatimonadota bacterium]
MAGYSRKTVLGPSEILERAHADLPHRLGLTRTRSSGHGATYSGKEGTVTVSAHRHSQYTVVTTSTDQLRTSRMDYEIQRFLNLMPYEHGDEGGRGEGDPN